MNRKIKSRAPAGGYTSLRPWEVMVRESRSEARDRVGYCLRLLWVHGFVSDAERDKIAKRISAWMDHHAKSIGGVA